MLDRDQNKFIKLLEEKGNVNSRIYESTDKQSEKVLIIARKLGKTNTIYPFR